MRRWFLVASKYPTRTRCLQPSDVIFGESLNFIKKSCFDHYFDHYQYQRWNLGWIVFVLIVFRCYENLNFWKMITFSTWRTSSWCVRASGLSLIRHPCYLVLQPSSPRFSWWYLFSLCHMADIILSGIYYLLILSLINWLIIDWLID